MLPIGVTLKPKKKPVVNTYLILINTAIFLLMILFGKGEIWILSYGLIPTKIKLFSFFSSMFIHASFGHLFFNMLFLYIFGNNVEDALGKTKYLVFYITSGLGASILSLLFNQGSNIPAVGASGAIYGVLGAYALLYPLSEVRFFMFNIFAFSWMFTNERLPRIKAIYLIFLYFLLDLYQGIYSQVSGLESGIGHFAHIGGFVFGMAGTFYLVSNHDVEVSESMGVENDPLKVEAKAIPADLIDKFVEDNINRYHIFSDDIIYSLTRSFSDKTKILISDYEMQEKIITRLIHDFVETQHKIDRNSIEELNGFLRDREIVISKERLGQIISKI